MKFKLASLLLAAIILGACSSASQYQETTQREINKLTRSACFEMPKVTVPTFPDRTFNVLDFGADPTGVALSTDAIQQAIDACNEQGGGTVILPSGLYQTGPLTLKSNVRLYTDWNCFVLFSHDLDMYESSQCAGLREHRHHRTRNLQRKRRLVETCQEEQDGRDPMEETSQRERRYRN